MQFVYDLGGYSTGDPDEKIIYLTFDAGYDNGYAADILDALAAHDAPAAFFLVAHYIEVNPDIVLRMAEEGALGVQSFNAPQRHGRHDRL